MYKTIKGEVLVILLILLLLILLVFFLLKKKKEKETYVGNLRVITPLDKKRALKYALKQICEEKGYKWYDDASNEFIYDCRHTKETCENESIYPTPEDQIPQYYEWRDSDSPDGETIEKRIPPTVQKPDGYCIMGNEEFRKLCLKEDLVYNTSNGECKTTKPYCNSKLLAFCDNDCYEPPNTMVLSKLFGNTLSRTLTATTTQLINLACKG